MENRSKFKIIPKNIISSTIFSFLIVLITNDCISGQKNGEFGYKSDFLKFFSFKNIVIHYNVS
jgi:hypothetical protein